MNLYNPYIIAKVVTEGIGTRKVRLKTKQLLILGFLAGVYIALGAHLCYRLMATILDPGLGIFIGATAFSIGLILVIIGGAELFTGNTIMVMSYLEKKIKLTALLHNWAIVFVANFFGAVFIAWCIVHSQLIQPPLASSPNATLPIAQLVGAKIISIAQAKTSLGFLPLFIRGILCNWLVCLALWLSIASQDIAGKVLVILFPIMAFVASGFEHSIANMFTLVAAMMVAPEQITLAKIVYNLIPVTMGNIVGGAFFVGALYWLTYYKLPAKIS